jgi:DNA repair exonuclease SbcCD ATPase subunit
MGKAGGIIDILAVALKFSILELLGFDGPIWLDEPFKHVSEDYIEQAGKLLTFMGQTSARQIILITHNQHLAQMCNRLIRVVQNEGRSSVIYARK